MRDMWEKYSKIYRIAVGESSLLLLVSSLVNGIAVYGSFSVSLLMACSRVINRVQLNLPVVGPVSYATLAASARVKSALIL